MKKKTKIILTILGLIIVLLLIIISSTLSIKPAIYSKYGATTMCHGLSFGELKYNTEGSGVASWPRCIGILYYHYE